MSVQDDKTAGQEDETAGGEDDKARADGDQQLTEKPEPDDDAKGKAAEMMTAYEDKPTLVLPGSGGAVSGTAIGAWLDDDGNPKNSEDADRDDEDKQEQVEKDMALNDKLRELAAEENKGEKRPSGTK
ncbi:MAG TPA: hypothetical protein VGN92_09175 [Mycobacterium sp.]|jgi:hypothetical protein|nr:hypothetical protein [Mycobacterium sp.]